MGKNYASTRETYLRIRLEGVGRAEYPRRKGLLAGEEGGGGLEVVEEVTEFMEYLLHCARGNKKGAVARILAVVKFFHEQWIGWSSRFSLNGIQAVKYGIRRSHEGARNQPRAKRPLTSGVLIGVKGREGRNGDLEEGC